jgi:hypothetical protein
MIFYVLILVAAQCTVALANGTAYPRSFVKTLLNNEYAVLDVRRTVQYTSVETFDAAVDN